MTHAELRLLIPHLLRHNDYIEVPSALAEIIIAVKDYTTECHIEAAKDTVNWKCESLPDCKSGYMRLWSRQDWNTTDNVRRRLKERMAAEREQELAASAEFDRQRNAIIEHFSKTMPRELVLRVIIGSTSDNGHREKIQLMYKGMKENGVAI